MCLRPENRLFSSLGEVLRPSHRLSDRQTSEGFIMENSNTTIIRLSQSFEQQIGLITRVIGLMSPKFLVGLIDQLDLDANPRNSRLGSVTNAIQESIEKDEGALR